MIYKNSSVVSKHYKPSTSISNATNVENMSGFGKNFSLSLSLSLSFSPLLFSLSARQKFAKFTPFFHKIYNFSQRFKITAIFIKKFTTFIHFYKIYTWHDFKILKILKNLTQRNPYDNKKRTRFHR